MKIIINGDVFETNKSTLSYYDIVELACLNKDVLFSMTVSHPDIKGFIMYPKKKPFKVLDGMSVGAFHTGGA